MIVSAEISYYPLAEDFTSPIARFIEELSGEDLEITIGTMSTSLTGEYSILMKTLTHAMKQLMTDYPSVFTIKISNSCIVK